MLPDDLKIGVLTVSDRAHSGVYEDRGGPAIQQYLSKAIEGNWSPVARVVPDESHLIASAISEMIDAEGCCLVITTGGTGPAPRDVTPEATLAVGDRVMPGFGEAMRMVSMQKVPTAILSRQVAVLRGSSLVINLPGNPRAIAECLDVVFPAVPYCIELAGGPRFETRSDFVKSFRPKQQG